MNRILYSWISSRHLDEWRLALAGEANLLQNIYLIQWVLNSTQPLIVIFSHWAIEQGLLTLHRLLLLSDVGTWSNRYQWSAAEPLKKEAVKLMKRVVLCYMASFNCFLFIIICSILLFIFIIYDICNFYNLCYTINILS